MSASTRVTQVHEDDTFNLPLFEHHLVIDTRSTAEYEAGHIATAVSLPAPSAEDFSDEFNEALLVKFVCSLVEDGLQPENISPIVLYGDACPDGEEAGSDSQRFMRWLTERLDALKSNRPLQIATLYGNTTGGPAVVEPEEEYSPVLVFSKRLRDYAEDVSTLIKSVLGDISKYRYFCPNRVCSLGPTPYRTFPFLLQATRDIDKAVLSLAN